MGRYGKCHRKYTAPLCRPAAVRLRATRRGKGEMVRLLRELNVRAHRPDGDGRGRANPTWSKTK